MAEALPVRSIPEQHHVAFVRDDVVKVGGYGNPVMALALRAERVFSQIRLAGLLPLIAIAAGC